MNSQSSKPLIIIGLATFQRPVMLKNALESLNDLDIPTNVTVKLILVDNDPAGGAEIVYRECAESLKIESEYFVEGRRGISNIRNTILSHALAENAAYLIFFDDDEMPSQQWLAALYSTAVSHSAQAVSGRVLYTLPDEAESWVHTGQYFCDKSLATGSPLGGASTANVLIDLAFVKEKSLHFHEAFNLSGGGDTFFFRSLISLGGKIVWSEEAVTHETVPLSRVNETWILGRAYKVGYTTLLRSRLSNSRTGFIVEGLQFMLVQFSMFLWDAIISIVKRLAGNDKSSWVNAKRKWYKVNGAYSFLRSKQHEEYRRIDGH